MNDGLSDLIFQMVLEGYRVDISPLYGSGIGNTPNVRIKVRKNLKTTDGEKTLIMTRLVSPELIEQAEPDIIKLELKEIKNSFDKEIEERADKDEQD